MFLLRPEQRAPWQSRYLTYVCQADATVAQTATLVHNFVAMVRQRQGAHLDAWLAAVQAGGVPELQAFATGVRNEYAAVKAGLTLDYSNGQTEAHIQRLKLLKRQMYGRAGFELLRIRVLHREQPRPITRRPHVGT